MFEFIGIAFVAWLAWKIYKKVSGTFMVKKSVDTAARLGVPRERAVHLLMYETERIAAARDLVLAGNDWLRARSLPEQFGYAIKFVYTADQDQVKEAEEAKQDTSALEDKLRVLLSPQIGEVLAEHDFLYLNHVVFAYVSALARAIDGKGLPATKLVPVTKSLFQGYGNDNGILAAEGTLLALGPADLKANEAKLAPLAKREVSTGSGDYYVKYARKLASDIAAMFEPKQERVDLSKVPEPDILDV